MTQSLNLNNTLSILHTNIQSLNCNGEKLETLLQSIDLKCVIVSVSETWNSENKKHLFNPIKMEGYNNYEGETGSSLCVVYMSKLE